MYIVQDEVCSVAYVCSFEKPERDKFFVFISKQKMYISLSGLQNHLYACQSIAVTLPEPSTNKVEMSNKINLFCRNQMCTATKKKTCLFSISV